MSVIDDSEAISFEVEDFQVLDECVGEEDTPPNDDKPLRPEKNDSKMASGDGEEIDFTADIGLDHLNDQDVMDHLNEIENIVLDAKSFGLEPSEEDKPSKDEGECPDIILLEPDKFDDPAVSDAGDDEGKGGNEENNGEKRKEEVVNPEHQWYEEKFNAKVSLVKDRLAKLSRVIEATYKDYRDYLQKQAAKNSTAVCKLDPPRRCPLDKPHTNRWKFNCTRKPLEESPDTVEEIKDDNTISKIVKTVWRLTPTGDSVSNANALQTNPPFVMHAVKIFEDYINTEAPNEDDMELKSKDDDKTESSNDEKESWLSLLVRSNSNDELMLFATGKEIPQDRLEGLKLIYESGDGKECKVKSLYCKNTSTVEGALVCQTVFLSGSETLDETVGDLKIQLAPKTNFNANKIGAEQLGKAVQDLLNPSSETTVIDVGCGLGLICLMLASKCDKVIGLDSQSEIEEAEMTCDLNKIKNATFVMGESIEVMQNIANTVINRPTSAVINANTSVARDSNVMWGLRKINSLRRIVMITTLTRPTVRPILELMKPGETLVERQTLGRPFVPIKAVLVDTLPSGQYFEIAILLERRPLSSLIKQKSLSTTCEKSPSRTSEKSPPNPSKSPSNSSKKSSTIPPKTLSLAKGVSSTKRPPPPRRPIHKSSITDKTLVKNPFHEKSTPKSKMPYKSSSSSSSSHAKIPAPRAARAPKPILKKSTASKRSHNDCESFKISVPTKMLRPSITDPNDLRSRLNHNRSEPDLAQQVREQQRILEAAKQKLTSPSVDPTTARQLQDILNLALEKTNNMQSQLPRSVWDRIAPPEGSSLHEQLCSSHQDIVLKGSFVEERGGQDIVITTPNAKFNDSGSRRYDNISSGSPNLMTSGYSGVRDHRKGESRERREKPYDRGGDKWGSFRRSSPKRGSDRGSPRRASSPRWPSPRRASSPSRRHYSPGRSDGFRRSGRSSPVRAQMSPQIRRNTPQRAQLSPMRRNSPVRRQSSPARRGLNSPQRRQLSPPRRQLTPPRRDFEVLGRRSIGQIGTLGQIGQNDGIMRRQLSPPRRQSSPRRQLPATVTPMFGDDWDIPSRGAVEQQSNWQRQNERPIDRNLNSNLNSNWNFQPQNDGIRSGGGLGGGGGGGGEKVFQAPGPRNDDNWMSKQNLSDNRWSGGGPSVNDSNWGNNRSKETFLGGKEDWNDLPEDARDPWDDGGSKDRWQGQVNQGNHGNHGNQSVWAGQGQGSGGQRWNQGQGTPGGQGWGQRPGGFSGGFPGRGFGGFNDGR